MIGRLIGLRCFGRADLAGLAGSGFQVLVVDIQGVIYFIAEFLVIINAKKVSRAHRVQEMWGGTYSPNSSEFSISRSMPVILPAKAGCN